MTMKLFTAGLATETNTFSPMPTGYAQYAECMLVRGGVPDDAGLFGAPLVVFRRLARERGWNVVESLCAFAEPAGRTTRSTYEGFRDEILADLRAAMPVDVVLLNLHGAMVADGYDDCEGDLLAHVRAIVGPEVPVGAELDPHCHLTAQMRTHADALVCFKEYPHTDFAERAAELFQLIADRAEGKTRPHMAVYDCRMISNYFTTTEPMRSYVAQLKALEGRDGVLSISVAHGFPWGDVPDVGTRLLVVTDNQPEKGEALARELGLGLIALRGQTHAPYATVDEALGQVRRTLAGGAKRPVVLADTSDNAGGGAPSDNTVLLRALLEQGITDAAVALLWDPVAVSMAFAAGEGATLPLRIGGKMGPMSAAPLDETFTVTRLLTDGVQPFGTAPARFGDAAALHCKGVDVVINSLRTQVFHPDVFTRLGIDPAQRKLLVVKSSNHFRAGFEPLAEEIIYVAAPGAITPDFANIPFTRLDGPRWPIDPHLFDQ